MLACDEHHFQRDDAMTTGFQPQVQSSSFPIGYPLVTSHLEKGVTDLGILYQVGFSLPCTLVLAIFLIESPPPPFLSMFPGVQEEVSVSLR